MVHNFLTFWYDVKALSTTEAHTFFFFPEKKLYDPMNTCLFITKQQADVIKVHPLI